MEGFRRTDATRKDRVKAITYIVLYFISVIIGAVFLLPKLWIFWLLIIGEGLALLVTWHARTFTYRCANCGCEFEVSPWRDFASLQGVGRGGHWKRLNCPNCGQTTRAAALMKGKGAPTLRAVRGDGGKEEEAG